MLAFYCCHGIFIIKVIKPYISFIKIHKQYMGHYKLMLKFCLHKKV